MAAVLPKLDISQVQTNPAPGTAVPPGTVVTYKIVISSDAAATAGAANAALAVVLGSNLTLNAGSVSLTDPNGGTDLVTPTGGGGFNVTFGNTIATNAQPITITYTATVGAGTPQNTTLTPKVDITYQNASPDELVYATDNVNKTFYQYDVATHTISNFGTPSSPQDSVEFDGRGNLVYTGTSTGLSLYNLSSGTNTLLVAGQGFADETITPDHKTVFYNGSSNGHNALYAYDLTTNTNRLVVQHSGTNGFTGLATDPAGHLFASFGTNSGLYNTGGAGTIAQIDPTTGAILRQTAVLGNGLDACVYDSYTGHIFVTSAVTGASPNVWEVDPTTMAVVKTFSIPNPRLDGISSDGKGNLFIARYHDAIVQLDLVHNTQTVVASTPEIDDTIPIANNPVFDSKASTNTLVGSGSLSGTVFLDQNADGVKLAGDTPIAGATVQLLDSTGAPVAGKTTTTDASGNYSFANLTVGNYAVQITAPAGDSFSPVGTNANPALDSIVNSLGKTTPVAVMAGANTPNQNAGVYVPVSLSGTVFNDGNDDGVKNNADNAHQGATVQLLDSAGTPIPGKTATTDASGNYSFAGLKPGTYSVAVTPIAGDVFSPVGTNANPALDSKVNAAGKTTPVTLASGQTSINNNAGLFAPGSLSGTVFLDQNADGVKLAGDTSLAGLTVQLLDSTGTPIAGKTATTDASGNYSFTGLVPGSYAIAITAPAGDSFSPVGTNANPALDSIVNSLGKTTPVAVMAGANTPNQNAGVYVPVSLSGTVFNDNNDDGVKNGTDIAHAGIVVQLLDSTGTPIAGKTATTDASGNYAFTALKPGTYSVQVGLPAGDVFSPVGGNANMALDSEVNAAGKTVPVTLTSGQTSINNNAGLFAPGSLSGTVFVDRNDNGVKEAGDTPAAGVSVQLLDGTGTPIAGKTTTTDASGNYSFGGLVPGSYAVAFTAPAGDVFSPTGTNTNPALDSIVNSLGKTAPVAVANGTNTPNQNAGVYMLGSLSGTVFLDQNDDGVKQAGDTPVAGATVQLLDSAGTPIAGKTTTTDASGNYSFGGLVPGSYAVAITAPAGDGFSPVGTNANPALDSIVNAAGKTAQVAVTSGTNTPNQNAGVYAPVSLSGTVFQDQNGNGVKNAGDVPVVGDIVTLLDGAGHPTGLTTTTDANGNYRFTGLKPGTYEVAISAPTGEKFSPKGTDPNPALDSMVDLTGKTVPVTLTSGQSAPNQNAGVYFPATINGNVFLDAHCDGKFDYGDPAFKGVTVKLFDGSGNFTGMTALTDANGAYSFATLLPGQYQVRFVLPFGTDFTDGTPGADSKVDPVTGFSPVFTLASGQTDNGQGAGLELTGGYANSPTTYLDATHTAIGGNGSGITVIGGPGPQNDIINGGAGNNILVGGNGSNIIESGTGTNLILGGCGPMANIQSLGTNDFVFGSAGDDLIQGHAGNAFIAAGPGNQTIVGGGGTNIFIANANRGTITETAGVFSNIAVGDTFITAGHTNSVYEKGDGVLYIEDYDAARGDTLTVYGFSGPTAVGQSGAYEVLYFGPNQAVLLRATQATIATPNLGVTYSANLPTTAPLTISVDPNNYLTLSQAGVATAIGAPPALPAGGSVALTQANPNYTGGNASTTVTGPGYDTVHLGGGDNTVTLAGYSNSIVVGNGNNAIQAGAGNSTITAGNGNNTIGATGYSNVANVGTGNDTIDIGSYANIHAAGGNQTIHLNGYSNMVFIGGTGASAITGGLGNSQITTTGGSASITLGGMSNVVTTGAASDTIADGAGYTRFVVGSSVAGQLNGTETISHFASTSLVDFVPLAAGGQTAGQLFATLHNNGSGFAELDFASGGAVVFAGLTANQLHQSNFQVG